MLRRHHHQGNGPSIARPLDPRVQRPEPLQALPPGWRLEDIDPSRAYAMLECDTHNRPLQDTRIQMYASIMKAGQWRPYREPIVFSKSGRLLDGQHRLWAIIESGTVQKFMVDYSAEETDMMAIDQGLPRSAAVAINLAYPEAEMSGRVAALVRAFYSYPDWDKPIFTTESILAGSIKIKESSFWLFEKLPGHIGEFLSASGRAAICRAYYHTPPNDLIRLEGFVQVVRTGEMHRDDENAAVKFRLWYSEQRAMGGGGRVFATATYRRAQNAIRYFMARENLKQLKEAENDLYPIRAAQHLDLPKATKQTNYRKRQAELLENARIKVKGD